MQLITICLYSMLLKRPRMHLIKILESIFKDKNKTETKTIQCFLIQEYITPIQTLIQMCFEKKNILQIITENTQYRTFRIQLFEVFYKNLSSSIENIEFLSFLSKWSICHPVNRRHSPSNSIEQKPLSVFIRFGRLSPTS